MLRFINCDALWGPGHIIVRTQGLGARTTFPGGSPRSNRHEGRLVPLDVAVWAIWFGLVGGTLEVATRVLCRAIDPAGRLYLMSRHFLWLTPLANVSLFFVLGLLLAGMARFWPRSGGWISLRLLCALAIQPMLILTAPRIYPQALFVLALGISTLLAPMLESRPRAQRRSVLVWSFPALWGLVLVLAVSIAAGDWIKQYREARRPVPPPGSPNVLFIVLDTVRADRLSLYGYRRSTSPTLERLARHGVRFDNARAPAVDARLSRQLFLGPLAA